MTLKELVLEKEPVCNPARFCKDAIIDGTEYFTCMYDKSIYCPYRHSDKDIDVCMLGQGFSYD